MTPLLYLAAPALACAIVGVCVLFDRAALKRRRAAESAAMRARIADLRKDNRAFEELYGAP